MSSSLSRQPNDVAVHSIPASRPTDPRVRLAPEDWLANLLAAWQASLGRIPQWMSDVKLNVNGHTLSVQGEWKSSIYPARYLEVDAQIEVPPLESSGSVVARQDYLYLVTFVAVSGQEHDPALGQIDYEAKSSDGTITAVRKENALRDRAYYVLVISQQELTPESFYSALPKMPYRNLDPIGTLQVPAPSNEGWALSSWRIFAADDALTQADYPILEDFIEVAPVASISRLQNWAERGFTWGLSGEGALELPYHLEVLGKAPPREFDVTLMRRLMEVCSGKAPRYGRTVQNLIAGLVGGNPGRTGESAASPNGSAVIGSDNRITFSNQSVTQMLGVQIVTATTDGSGNAICTAQLPTDAPPGSAFSERRDQHRIFTADGNDESDLGQYSNLGGIGTLFWTAGANSSIQPGQTVYFVPAIVWAPGSGLGVPFVEVEQVWRNTVALDPMNILSGAAGEDLMAYQTPENGEDYFIVSGRERAAIHYIYKHSSVTADAQGVATIPAQETGCFAFIEGIPGRQDSPVVTGLTPNATYRALLYHSPRRNESWQLQLRYPRYQGLTDSTILDGATVVSEPLFYASSQGGGNSVFQADSKVQFSAVSMHLPELNQAPFAYDMDTSIRLANESRESARPFRLLLPQSAGGLALPVPGQTLIFESSAGTNIERGLAGKLLNHDGATLGFRTPNLYQRATFQAILSFLVEKAGKLYCVIATRNGNGGESAPLSSLDGTAFDIFEV